MSRTSLTKGLCNDSYPYVGMNKATRVMCRTLGQEYRNISQTLQVAFDIYLKHLGYSSNLSNTLHFVGAISAVVKFMISQHSRDSLMNPWSSPIALRIGKSQNVIKKKNTKITWLTVCDCISPFEHFKQPRIDYWQIFYMNFVSLCC